MDASMKCMKRSRRTNRWPHPPSKAKCPRPSRILDLPSSSSRRWLSSLFVHSLSHLDLHDDRLGHLDTFLLSYLYLLFFLFSLAPNAFVRLSFLSFPTRDSSITPLDQHDRAHTHTVTRNLISAGRICPFESR